VGAGDMMMVRQTGSSMKRSKRVSIAELLDYGTEISRRPSLTLDDYALFLERAKDSLAYFAEFNGWCRPKHIETSTNKFFRSVHGIVWWKHDYLKDATEREHLTNNEYAQGHLEQCRFDVMATKADR